jgi:hypothetical protein
VTFSSCRSSEERAFYKDGRGMPRYKCKSVNSYFVSFFVLFVVDFFLCLLPTALFVDINSTRVYCSAEAFLRTTPLIPEIHERA